MRLMLAAAAILPFISTAAMAESWYSTGGNEKTQTYVDLDSLRPIGDKIVVVTKSVYAEPLCSDEECVIGSGDIRSEWDCAGNSFRTLEYSYYDLNDDFILTEPSETINERKVPAAGSINEATMDFVCYRRGGEFVEDPYADARWQFSGE
jgi:hypothetical protein